MAVLHNNVPDLPEAARSFAARTSRGVDKGRRAVAQCTVGGRRRRRRSLPAANQIAEAPVTSRRDRRRCDTFVVTNSFHSPLMVAKHTAKHTHTKPPKEMRENSSKTETASANTNTKRITTKTNASHTTTAWQEPNWSTQYRNGRDGWVVQLHALCNGG